MSGAATGPNVALERALALLGPELRETLALRLGYDPRMLAMGVAGQIVTQLADAYRVAVGRATKSVTAPAPLTNFDLGPLVTRLQVAAFDALRADSEAQALAERVLRGAVACALGEIADSGHAPGRPPERELAERLTAPEGCASRMAPEVVEYTQRIAAEAVAHAELTSYALEDLERLLGLRPRTPADEARLLRRPVRPPRIPSPLRAGAAAVPTNHVTWALINALRDAEHGIGWLPAANRGVLTHTTHTNRGRGAVRVSLDAGAALSSEAPDWPALWQQVRALDALTVDALLVCLAAWAADGGQPNAPVWISADAILDARGVQRMQRRGEPRAWQHGHRREDRLAAGRALAQLDSLWLDIEDVEIVPTRHGAPKRLRAESRALAVLDRVTERDAAGDLVFLAARVTPGAWARAYWDAGVRQLGLLSSQALAYDPYHERVEKWLALYLAFQFRWNARRVAPRLSRRVATLLAQCGLAPDGARPGRVRARLEKACDRLTEDGLLAGWSYATAPLELPARGWLPLWLEATLWLTPPADLRARQARLRAGATLTERDGL